MRLAALIALAAALAAPSAEAAVKSYALVVGVNTSVDAGVARLHFADDDAAKYARLFDRAADQTTLLAVFDAESRLVYQDLAARARVPERLELERAVAALRAAAARDHAEGHEVVVYFAYVGHGARAADGEGYVNLSDGRLTRRDLHRLLIEQPADPAARFDTLHVIVDACSAYFVVHDRGAGLSRADEDYSGHMGELFGSSGAQAERTPHVGFLLATTGDVKVHEWSAYRGGVFSHLVRSGLSGAADVDLDGRVTYAELGAFIAAASGTIKDPRARVDVTVTPPPARTAAPLTDRNRFRPRQLVFLDAQMAGHYEIETEHGERVLDLNKPHGQPSVFALWGAGRYYLTGKEGETVLDFSKKSVLASASLAFGERRRGERGSIDEEYRRALFSRPFDYSFYRAYCSLLRLPVPDAPGVPAIPEEVHQETVVAAVDVPLEGPLTTRLRTPPTAPATAAVPPPGLAVSENRVRTGAWVALGAGVVLGAGAALAFGLGSGAEAGTDEAMYYQAAGAGASVGGGAALIVSVALIALDLSRPAAPVRVAATSNGVALSASF